MTDEKTELTKEEIRKATVKAYRHMGFLLEAHPELPMPTSLWIWPNDEEYEIRVSLGSYSDPEGRERVRERMAAIARALRKSYFRVEKDMSGDSFKLTVPLGDLWTLVISCDKKEVCERRVVGVDYVDEPQYEQVFTGTKTVPRERVEWDCTEPLLGGS